MAKPTKVRYSGIGVFANGFLLSRVQTVSADVDLGEEEARELTNSEVVEFTANNPQVTVNIETNEYGSCRNIRSIVGISGGPAAITTAGGSAFSVNVNSFDGSAADIGIMVEQDNVLARTTIINDAFVTSLSWNFDVGGVATESFSLEADNKTWYLNNNKQMYSLKGYSPSFNLATFSGGILVPTNFTSGSAYVAKRQYIDGYTVTGALIATGFNDGGSSATRVSWIDNNFTASGSRYRTLIYKVTPDTTIPQRTSTSTIGSITRGKLDIYLASSFAVAQTANYGTLGSTNFLRLQSCTIDADLSREVLNELGHFRAYDRSLTLPVDVNVTFSVLSSDLEEWGKFVGLDFTDTVVVSSFDITQFKKTAVLQVRIFDKQDTETGRSLLKSITITGLQIVSESFGADVGGNASQDFTGKSSNFTVSGLGIAGYDPITMVPTT